MSQYAADRENAMAAAAAASECGDYEDAYTLYLKVLDSYPRDARVILLAAQAAVRADHLEEAIALYQRDLAQVTRNSWSIRSGLMEIYIKLNRWQDFEALRLDTRKASLAGDKTLLPEDGYHIETLYTGREFISVLEFPTLHGDNHTRDRFQLYEERDPCTGFTPYIDLESDQGKDGSHGFSLVASTSPTSQWSVATQPAYPLSPDRAYSSAPVRWLLKSYPDGEPSYQQVRADILTLIAQPLTEHHNLSESCPSAPPSS